MKTKILIIKLGYSETLDPEIGRVPSLGDVLRTTPILRALKEKYPDSHITWLATEHTEPLLHKNELIDRLLIWDTFVPFQLMKEKFDLLINLEKVAGLCALTDMIDAWVKYGFRFEAISGTYHAYENGMNFISYIQGKKTDKSKSYWQQTLIEMFGVPWKEQEYIVGYKPKTEECFDVGFNFEVGSKWPVKGMSMERWQELEKRLIGHRYTVSWQQGRKNLYEYMDWINSCKLIISNDSLGLHLAFAFNKNVIGLFGPTDPSEIYFYAGGRLLVSEQECQHKPCISTKCLSGHNCMNSISLDSVEATAIEALSHGNDNGNGNGKGKRSLCGRLFDATGYEMDSLPISP
jgi:heptosyltransferase-2